MNITSYITSLDHEVRPKLYESPWTCQAVLRALPPLTQQYIARLLYIDEPVPKALLASWVKPEHESGFRAAEASLRQLCILQEAGDKSYVLNEVFKAQLRLALAGGTGDQQTPDELVLEELPSAEEAAAFARRQWEGLLHFILSPDRATPPHLPVALRKRVGQDGEVQPLDVPQLAEAAGLITSDRRSLSGEGFQFMLLDTYSQLWTLLRSYISTAQATSGGALCSALSFLMQLGFTHVGRPYSFDALGPMERSIAAHCTQLGLLHVFIAGAAAASAGAALGAGSHWEVGGGYIIVETNYRVYAYTSSPLQPRILGRFVTPECVLPNLFVGTLRREGVQAALGAGLTADAMVSFLTTHAHPWVLAHRKPIVPEVVSDQLRLWEAEMQRVRTTPAMLYDEFETIELYNASLRYARQLGVVLWEGSAAPGAPKIFAVTQEGHPLVREHIKALKSGHQGLPTKQMQQQPQQQLQPLRR